MGKMVGLAVVVLGLGGLTVGVSAWEWGEIGGTGMGTAGYVALALGAVVAMIVGSGLMGLIFFSSRRGYDEAPELENAPDGHRDATTKA